MRGEAVKFALLSPRRVDFDIQSIRRSTTNAKRPAWASSNLFSLQSNSSQVRSPPLQQLAAAKAGLLSA